MFLTTTLAFTAPVRADHIFEAAIVDPPLAILPAPAGNRIGILGPCARGITDIDFPANAGFFVAHGWTFENWNGSSWLEKRAFASPATVFEVWVDGVLQPSAMHTALFPTPDGQIFGKLNVAENHYGLSGTRVFVGLWYYDASDPSIGGQFGERELSLSCSVTVHFVP